jgi:hypothetical protein
MVAKLIFRAVNLRGFPVLKGKVYRCPTSPATRIHRDPALGQIGNVE